jgi:hypothetical protein
MQIKELIAELQKGSSEELAVIKCQDGDYYDIEKVHINDSGSAVLDESEEESEYSMGGDDDEYEDED